eukprot:12429173-Karenia_brevis.AAC.1
MALDERDAQEKKEDAEMFDNSVSDGTSVSASAQSWGNADPWQRGRIKASQSTEPDSPESRADARKGWGS